MADDALLDEVRAAAEARLQARVGGQGADDAGRRALLAAHAALDAGNPVTAIAAAEAAGEREARERSAGQVLRSVERVARNLRETTHEYEGVIAHAVRLGLPARDIAARAQVSHGTVAAVARRHGPAESEASEQTAAESADSAHREEPPPESGTG